MESFSNTVPNVISQTITFPITDVTTELTHYAKITWISLHACPREQQKSVQIACYAVTRNFDGSMNENSLVWKQGPFADSQDLRKCINFKTSATRMGGNYNNNKNSFNKNSYQPQNNWNQQQQGQQGGGQLWGNQNTNSNQQMPNWSTAY